MKPTPHRASRPARGGEHRRGSRRLAAARSPRVPLLADPRERADLDVHRERRTRHDGDRGRPAAVLRSRPSTGRRATTRSSARRSTRRSTGPTRRAGDIELAVIRHRAKSGKAIGSLLTNPGGPGASGVALMRDSLDFAVGAPLQDAYDVIGFDPRGVGESTAVNCYDAADMDAYLFDILPGPRGSDAWTQAIDENHRAFGEACDANSNGILPYITTENAARDMDLLRGVLGDKSSTTSATRTARSSARPTRSSSRSASGGSCSTARSTPRCRASTVSTTQGIGFEIRAARVHGRLPRRSATARSAVPSTRPWPTSAPCSRASTRAAAGVRRTDARRRQPHDAIVAALYSEENWKYLTTALTDALAGNPEVAFLLADFYYNRAGRQVQGQLRPRRFDAYNCMDYPVDATPEQKAAADALLAEKAPTVAPYWSGPDPCAVWPYPPRRPRDDHRGWRRADRRRRHYERSGDPVRMGGVARRPARPGAGHPGGRRPHRLQQGQ